MRSVAVIELADVFRRFADGYLSAHDTAMPASHRRAIADILACRTEALGGHLWRCDRCSHEVFSYHSCKTQFESDDLRQSSSQRRSTMRELVNPAPPVTRTSYAGDAAVLTRSNTMNLAVFADRVPFVRTVR